MTKRPQSGGPGGGARGAERSSRKTRRPTPPQALPPEPAPANAAGATFRQWATRRMALEARCLMEPSYSCVALADDPICQCCYMEGVTGRERVRDPKKVTGSDGMRN